MSPVAAYGVLALVGHLLRRTADLAGPGRLRTRGEHRFSGAVRAVVQQLRQGAQLVDDVPAAHKLVHLVGRTAVITVFVALLAAYPLSRYHMRFRKPFLYTIVFSTGLPITAILVPVYGMFAQLQPGRQQCRR